MKIFITMVSKHLNLVLCKNLISTYIFCCQNRANFLQKDINKMKKNIGTTMTQGCLI